MKVLLKMLIRLGQIIVLDISVIISLFSGDIVLQILILLAHAFFLNNIFLCSTDILNIVLFF